MNNDAGENDDTDIVLDFSDQGDMGKAPRRPPQFNDFDVRVPPKGTALKLHTPNFDNLEGGFKEPQPVDTPVANVTNSSKFPAQSSTVNFVLQDRYKQITHCANLGL